MVQKKESPKLWLITWEGTLPSAEIFVEAILAGRHSVDFVGKLVGVLWSRSVCDLEAMAAEAQHPRRQRPYAVDPQPGERWTCGHNPYLYARKVEGLSVSPDEQGGGTLAWIELPRYEVSGGAVRVARDRLTRTARYCDCRSSGLKDYLIALHKE